MTISEVDNFITNRKTIVLLFLKCLSIFLLFLFSLYLFLRLHNFVSICAEAKCVKERWAQYLAFFDQVPGWIDGAKGIATVFKEDPLPEHRLNRVQNRHDCVGTFADLPDGAQEQDHSNEHDNDVVVADPVLDQKHQEVVDPTNQDKFRPEGPVYKCQPERQPVCVQVQYCWDSNNKNLIIVLYVYVQSQPGYQ